MRRNTNTHLIERMKLDCKNTSSGQLVKLPNDSKKELGTTDYAKYKFEKRSKAILLRVKKHRCARKISISEQNSFVEYI